MLDSVLTSGQLSEKALLPSLLKVHIERSTGIVGIKQQFIKHYPQVQEYQHTTTFVAGQKGLDYLIGGTVSKKDGSDRLPSSIALFQNKNFNLLTTRRLKDYDPRPISLDNDMDEFVLKITLRAGIALKEVVACYESPHSIVFVGGISSDASQVIQKLSYSPHEHGIIGLDNPRVLRADVVADPVKRAELVEAIRAKNCKFLNSLTIAAVTLLGDVPLTLPIASYATKGSESAEQLKQRLLKWKQKLSKCLECLNENQECVSVCVICTHEKTVCVACSDFGFKQWDHRFRACEKCTARKVKCVRRRKIYCDG